MFVSVHECYCYLLYVFENHFVWLKDLMARNEVHLLLDDEEKLLSLSDFYGFYGNRFGMT